MNDEFDLTREVAEKILKRAMTPLREFLDSDRNDDDISLDEVVELTVGQIREMNRDLGALGLTLATRYREQMEYQTALGVMSAENVRLHGAVELLAELATKYSSENSKLITDLSKTRTKNDKLQESTMKGF